MHECTSCVSRRDFLAGSTLSAVAVFLAACSGDEAATEPTPTTPVNAGGIRLADYPALATVGGIARVNGTSVPVAVVRASTDRYRAFSLRCPHAGSTVAIQGNGFRCPNHGATFDATGAWTGGQRTSGLQELSVTLNAAAGTITINS